MKVSFVGRLAEARNSGRMSCADARLPRVGEVNADDLLTPSGLRRDEMHPPSLRPARLRVQDRGMTDYGHDIDFGTFITPVNRPPRQAVERAQLAERLGFDLATFQDHPYQPAFHDTWTLISFVAASTSRIRLAGNVHNLPLRQPAVLARSIASLDLLTEGRVEFGLGAGGFWDAIEAMGGRRLAPADAVTALSQAIDVIRGVWDVDGEGRLVAGGEFHHVDGAKRGPRPAHDVP